MSDQRPPSGFVVFCDDIREELRNKASLMGIYMGDMLLHHPEFPATLPKFGMMVQFEQPIHDVKDFRIEVYFPGDETGKPTAQTDVPASERKVTGKTSSGKEATKVAARLHLVVSPLVLKGPGTVKVVAIRNGEEPVDLGKLEIVHAPQTATAAPEKN